MAGIYALTIILVIFAVGEMSSTKTNAMLSQAFVGAVGMLVYFWLGFPNTLVADSGVGVIGFVLSGVLIAGVGSTINFNELLRQWKTILIAVVSVLGGVVGIIIFGSMIIGREQAVAGAPIFSGSIAAVIIMSDFFNSIDRQQLSALCSMLLTVQTLFGLPLSTIMMRKAAQDFVKDPANIAANSQVLEKEIKSKKKLLNLPVMCSTSVVVLAKLALTASVAFFLAGLTGGSINYMVMALFVGVVFTSIGFLDEFALNKTGCSSLFMVLILAGLFKSFAFITPADLISMIVPIITILGLGSLFTGIIAIVLAKITKMNPYLCIAMGLTCMYGFPTTLFISQDVAKAYGKTEAEHTALTNYLVPKIVTAGIATVTIASVIIAGYAIKIF